MTRVEAEELILGKVFFNTSKLVNDTKVREALAVCLDYSEDVIATILETSPEIIATLADIIANSETYLEALALKQSLDEKNVNNGYQGIDADGSVSLLGNLIIKSGNGITFKNVPTLLNTISNTDYSAYSFLYLLPASNKNYRIEYSLKAGTTVSGSVSSFSILVTGGSGTIGGGVLAPVNPAINTVYFKDINNANGSRQVYISPTATFIVKFNYIKFYELNDVFFDTSFIGDIERKSNRNQPNGYPGLGSDGKTAKEQLPADVQYTDQKNQPNGYQGLGSDGKAAKAQLPSDIQYTGQKNQPNGYPGLGGDGMLIVGQMRNLISDTEIEPDLTWSSEKIETELSNKANAVHTHVLADITDYNEKFKGKFTTLIALQTAHPTANAGDYAQVDLGAGHDVINYNWDAEEGWIVGSSLGSSIANTDELVEGTTNLYFTVARTLASVLGSLTGLVVNTAISAGDTIKEALGKLQGQMNSEVTARADADTTLQTNIDNEATARANADTALQTQLNQNRINAFQSQF